LSKLTVKQATFCQKYLECDGNASEAYRRSYNAENMKPNTIHRKASELMANGMVRARIEELQELAQNRQLMTLDRIIGMHTKTYEKAMALDQTSAAVSASNSIARLLGYVIEKSEQKVDVEHKFLVAEEAKSNVMKLKSVTKKEKAEPTRQIRMIEDRVH